MLPASCVENGFKSVVFSEDPVLHAGVGSGQRAAGHWARQGSPEIFAARLSPELPFFLDEGLDALLCVWDQLCVRIRRRRLSARLLLEAITLLPRVLHRNRDTSGEVRGRCVGTIFMVFN